MADQAIELRPIGASGSTGSRFLSKRQVRVGARLLAFYVVMFLLGGIGRRAAFTLLGLLHSRGIPVGPSSPYPSLLIDGFGFITLCLACWSMAQFERKRVGEYGLPVRREALGRLGEGALWGVGAMSAVMLVLWGLGAVEFASPMLGAAAALRSGAIWAAALLATALFEEYQFRGYALLTLGEGITFWPAALVLSTLFALGHAGNPGESKLGLLAVFVFGVAFSWLVRVTGSLWFAVGFHLTWDWAESFLYGVPDSGVVSEGRLLAPSFHGPAWLTGGTAGPEGSILCLLALLATVCIVQRLGERRRRQRLLSVGPHAG